MQSIPAFICRAISYTDGAELTETLYFGRADPNCL